MPAIETCNRLLLSNHFTRDLNKLKFKINDHDQSLISNLKQ